MAVDDLDLFHDRLPEMFATMPLPPDWDEEWWIISVDSPEAKTPNDDELTFGQAQTAAFSDDISAWPSSQWQSDRMPRANKLQSISAQHAGGLQTSWGESNYPPPDALAFYLPFHYFFPVWWGIYLTVEGARDLSLFIQQQAMGELTAADSMLASRLFLYGHEAYHHRVESFATRLEATHRVPLFQKGFEKVYQSHRNTDECIEEALATRHGYKMALAAFAKNKEKTDPLGRALSAYIRGCPPGYRRALEFLSDKAFKTAQCKFAEDSHHEALNTRSRQEPGIWLVFSHAFSSISRITSRVNYIIHRNSPLAARLGLRYIRYPDLIRKLKELAGCNLVRHRGRHEIWENEAGKRFPVPRHPGDLKTGTLAKIIKQAGLSMTVQQFLSARPELIGSE